MAVTKKTKTTETSRSKKRSSAAAPRRLKKPEYRSFRLHKRIKPSQPKLPNVISLWRKSGSVLRRHWKLFAGIVAIYMVLNLILIRSATSGIDLVDVRDSAASLFGGGWSKLLVAGALLTAVVGSSSSTASSTAAAYQPIVMIAVALATIWALRHSLSNKKVRIRDSFYKGFAPFVPFVAVLLVMALQMIPFALGAWMYSIIITKGIAITLLEKTLWFLILLLLALLSFYMASSSVFALFIVSLPDMTPMRALRSARTLVRYRRWLVLRKVLFLPLSIFIIIGLVMLPVLLWLTGFAEVIYFGLTMLAWPLSVTYLYMLYRELLNE